MHFRTHSGKNTMTLDDDRYGKTETKAKDNDITSNKAWPSPSLFLTRDSNVVSR